MTVPEIQDRESEIERSIAASIDPWLQHMRWRADFGQWREARLWQEKNQGQHLAFLKARLGEIAGKRVLDVGCGMGGFITALRQRGADARGLDFNFDYCRITDLRGLRYELDLEAVQAAGENIPFRENTFDAVTCWDILEHVQNPELVLAEVQRVLRPGGQAFVTVVNRYAARDPHYHLYWVNWLPRRLGEFYIQRRQRTKTNPRFRDRQTLSEMHYYTFRGFRRLVRRSGWEALDLEEEKLRRGGSSRGGLRGIVLRLLRAAGLLVPAYRLHRWCWRGTYHLVLQKGAAVSD